MRANRTKPGGTSPASMPVGEKPPRRRASALLVGLLTLSGMALPLYLSNGSAEPWMAAVTLSVRDPAGLPLAATLEKSLADVSAEPSLGRAVDLLGLDRDPEFSGTATGSLSLAYELLTGTGAGPSDPRSRAVRALGRHIAVSHAPGQDEARLLVRASSADKAIRIAEALATVYAAATEITGAVPQRDVMSEVDKAETALAEFRASAGSEKLTAVLAKRSRLKRLDANRAELTADTSAGDAIRDVTLNDVLSGRLGSAIADDQLTTLGKAYADASMQYSALSVSLGPKHPRLQSARAELEKSRAALQDRLKRLKARDGEAQKARQKMLASLDAERLALQGEITVSEIDLARYDALVASVTRAREAARAPAASEKSTSPIYDASAPAALPASPVVFPWWQMAAGGMSGLGAALAFVLARRPARSRKPEKPARSEPPRLSNAVPEAHRPARPVQARDPAPEPPRPVQRDHLAANALPRHGAVVELAPLRRAAATTEVRHVRSDVPTLEKLRHVAPNLFEADGDDPAVERIREELADLRRRVLVSAVRRV